MTWMLQGMLWDTSLLDPEEGIRFRGFSIPELQVSALPAAVPAKQQRWDRSPGLTPSDPGTSAEPQLCKSLSLELVHCSLPVLNGPPPPPG